ncbi:MAG: bifunctional precorrin-2 dehydrogenase/sirohydrochlorin ferrochelatase [Desulfomonilaceae bacterium]
MKPYPVMMNLQGKQVVVVGGGRVAHRKVTGLLDSEANVAVISPDLVEELHQLYFTNRITWVPEKFSAHLLDRFEPITLIFGATDIREVNVSLSNEAMKRRIPCNIADVPDLCTFIVPAVITQGELMIAVSTGGASPALARRIREDLEKKFGPEYAVMTRLMGELRKQIVRSGSDSEANKKVFLEIVDSQILPALRNNDIDKVVSILSEIIPKDIDVCKALDGNRDS